ncbi:glycosyltransferase [Streptomyces sp. NPDC050704]|uniref:glycosyltransferase n=1 Tax=Streptomyces sp. NPDC050704 TaxID=3157219 RepID=UPI00342C34E8
MPCKSGSVLIKGQRLRPRRRRGGRLRPSEVASRRAMRRERPDALFSKGSYVSVPVGIAAWLCRVPIVIHESDHSLGLANKILARMAARVCLSVTAPVGTPRWLAPCP